MRHAVRAFPVGFILLCACTNPPAPAVARIEFGELRMPAVDPAASAGPLAAQAPAIAPSSPPPERGPREVAGDPLALHVEGPKRDAFRPMGSVPDAQRVLLSLREGFMRCYQNALKSNPDQEESIKIAVDVNADGTVRSATTNAAKLSTEAVNCLLARVREAKFSPPDRVPARLVIPVTFLPR
jgi:hypothetical protein